MLLFLRQQKRHLTLTLRIRCSGIPAPLPHRRQPHRGRLLLSHQISSFSPGTCQVCTRRRMRLSSHQSLRSTREVTCQRLNRSRLMSTIQNPHFPISGMLIGFPYRLMEDRMLLSRSIVLLPHHLASLAILWISLSLSTKTSEPDVQLPMNSLQFIVHFRRVRMSKSGPL